MTVALCSNKQQWWFNIGLINAEHCALRLITSSGRKQNADRVHNSGSCMSLKSLCLKSKSRTGKCWKSHKFVCFIPGNALLKAIMFNSWAIEANWIWQQPQSTRGSEVPRSKHTHCVCVPADFGSQRGAERCEKLYELLSVPLNRTLMITRTWPCGGSVVNKTLLCCLTFIWRPVWSDLSPARPSLCCVTFMWRPRSCSFLHLSDSSL